MNGLRMEAPLNEGHATKLFGYKPMLSQLLLALPLAALYAVSIGVAWVFARAPLREPATFAG